MAAAEEVVFKNAQHPLESLILEFTPRRYRELQDLPPSLEVVENLLPASGTACIFGRSGAGKTFLVIDLMLAIARGDHEWFGRRIMQRPVVYLALEGEGGIRDRLNAHIMGSGRGIPDDFTVIYRQFDISNAEHLQAMVEAIKRLNLNNPVIVVDTLTRATPGLDLNGPKDMGVVISSSDDLQRRLGGLVISVYHSSMKGGAENSDASELGHSSYRGSLDASIFVYCDKENNKYWSAKKVKDASEGDAEPFHLGVVEVRRNQWGNPKTSCYVVPGESPKIDFSGIDGRSAQDLKENRHNASMDQVENLLISKLKADRPEFYTKRDLEDQRERLFCSAKTTISRQELRDAVSDLIGPKRRLELRDLPSGHQRNSRKQYLHPVRLDSPNDPSNKDEQLMVSEDDSVTNSPSSCETGTEYDRRNEQEGLANIEKKSAND